MQTRVLWLCAALQFAAGLALVVAPFLAAEGSASSVWLPDSASIIELKPVYGWLLLGAGVALAALGIATARQQSGLPASLAIIVAAAAGLSLGEVVVSDSNGVTAGSGSMFDLRGTGPWTVVVASAVGAVGATCAAALIGVTGLLERGRSDSRASTVR